ncbi:hypothetical protein [Rufibacter soli]
MNIPVFISHPSALNAGQKVKFDFMINELLNQHLEPRSLGRSDYPTLLPLREVLSITRHCVGGVVLGFRQFETKDGIWKKGTERERNQTELVSFPTAWNQLEAGIMYALNLPMLIFREEGVEGGIFDVGSSDVFVHTLPNSDLSLEQSNAIRQVFLRWAARVRQRYYRESESID